MKDLFTALLAALLTRSLTPWGEADPAPGGGKEDAPETGEGGTEETEDSSPSCP